MSEWEDRIRAAAARARTAMANGVTLDDVLRTFRDEVQLGSIETMKALRYIAPIDLACAKLIVSNWCEGRSYAHLTLADLDLLADAPVGRVDYFTRRHREDAIIERKPYMLYVRGADRAVDCITSAEPIAARGDEADESIELARVREEARKAATAWPTELRIVRDEPGLILLHFIRTPTR